MISNHRGPLRVAMVSANALPVIGGIETHIHEVSTRLGAEGVDVTVVATDRSGDLPLEENFPGYRMQRWPAYPRSRDYYLAPGLVRHLLRAEDYDIIHVQGVHNLIAPTALAAARLTRTPSVLTFHTGGHSSPVRGPLRPLQWRLLRPLLRSAAALVAVSEYERRTFAAVLGSADGDIRVIPNGCEPLPVDPSAENPEGNPLLVSAGRLERYKGHHRILQAFPAILAQAPDARLVVAGSGPYEQSLRAMARRLAISDRVSFCTFGPEQRAALGKLVADADVFCLLSEYESQGIAVMEALGAGTKALVADTSALSELGRQGLATTIPLEASPQQIAATALAIAAAPRTSPPAIRSWDDCADQLIRLYREVIA